MAGGAGGAALSEKERKDIMDNFQKIMEKPIVIQEEAKPGHRKNNINQSKNLSKISESSIKESMSFKEQKEEDEESIVDEVEDSMNKRESSSGDQIPESLPYDESAVASVKLTKLRQELGSEEAIR